ncbi:uncharacterized protein LOC106740521 [Alligator mississippiensis]|uniref:uncharacterized protein LOC106740521 n=1 Tax=Alligator mississippiensis TaxID=8496 RepID=UPI00287797E9|nr:uncharacterized protein LOC106740521 [Alligator mississippiensis]
MHQLFFKAALTSVFIQPSLGTMTLKASVSFCWSWLTFCLVATTVQGAKPSSILDQQSGGALVTPAQGASEHVTAPRPTLARCNIRKLKRASPYDPGLTGYDPRAGDCEIIPITPAVTPPESVSPTDATIKAVVKAHRRPPAVPGTGSRLFYIIPSPSYGRYIFYAPFQVPLYYRSYVPVKRRPYTYKYISPVKSQRAGSSEEWRRKREAPSILGKEGRMKDAKQKPNAALYFHSLKHIAPTNLEVEGNN